MRFSVLRALSIGWLSALAVWGTGCSGEEGEDPSATATISSFAAEPAEIVEGGKTTLRWVTKYAKEVSILSKGMRLPFGELPVNGEVEVTPVETTIYVLEASGKDGRIRRMETTVVVGDMAPPVIESFAPSSSVVARGDTVTLAWKAQGAESATITDGSGRIVAKDLPDLDEGEVEVEVRASTRYRLNVQNRQGSAHADVDVQVARAASIQLSCGTCLVDADTTATLSWTVVDAQAVRILDPAGGVVHEGPGEDGSVGVPAGTGGVYRAIATAIGGEVTSEATLSVRPLITKFEAKAFGKPRQGETVSVSWDVKGAEYVEITNSAGFSVTSPKASDTISAPVAAGGGFLLTAWNGSVSATQSATVLQSDLPLVRSFSADGVVTAGKGQQGVVTLRWLVDGAAKIRIDVEPGGMVDVTGKSPRQDSVDILFTAAGFVTLTATNPAGSTVYVIPAPVDPVPTIGEFFAAPSRVGSGESTTIFWETDATTVVLERDGIQVHSSASPSGSFPTGIVAAPSSFTLRAFNGLGFETISEPISVQVGSPNVVRFGTANGKNKFRVDTSAELRWENDGGVSLKVTDGVGGPTVFSSTDPREIRKGSCTVQMPSQYTEKLYVLEVANASGKDTEQLPIFAVTGPMIDAFYADSTQITVGDSVRFYWQVRPDVAGELPTLTLTDGITNYPMEGAAVPKGFRGFQIPNVGLPRTFTLQAWTSDPNPAEETFEVTVYGIPKVDSMLATPRTATAEKQPVQFSWTTTHASSMEIHMLHRDRVTVGSRVFSSNQKAVVEAGSTSIAPTFDIPRVRVTVRNPLGVSTTATYNIGVNAALVDELVASDTDILRGEEVTLNWQTSRSTTRFFNVGRGAWYDLSTSPTKRDITSVLSSSSTDTGDGLINFPSGFKFPFEGTEVQSIRMAVDGWTSFVYTSKPGAGRSSTWPASSVHAHLVPFQQDLFLRNQAKAFWDDGVHPQYGRFVTLQWKNWEFWDLSGKAPPNNLNFQIVMFEDGAFDFRYAKMESKLGTSGQRYFDGNDVQVAYQNIGGTKGIWAKPPSQEIYGGLNDRQLSLWLDDLFWTGQVPESGSKTFRPRFSSEYTLVVKNDHSEDLVTIPIRVHAPAALAVQVSPVEPVPGQNVTISWTGENLTSLTIEDASGAVVHRATKAELGQGSLTLRSLPQGDYHYTVRGVGAIARDQVVRQIDLFVYAPFSLDSFGVSTTKRKVTDPPVVLSWTTTNATSMRIVEQPTGVIHPITANMSSGSLSLSPGRTTTYRLEVESHGRWRAAERRVEVRTAWIDDLSAAQAMVAPGGTTTVSWQTNSAGVQVIPSDLPAGNMVEATGQSPFVSIASVGTLVPPVGSTSSTFRYPVKFPQGFTFPWFGKRYAEGQVMADGYFTFSMRESSSSSGRFQMPRNSLTDSLRAFALFWGDLDPSTMGEVYSHLVRDPADERKDHLILEWKDFRFASSSNNGSAPSLNFQLVLFRNGSFEYRYGNMAAATTAIASGSICSGGFQDQSATKGQSLFNLAAMAGGLANRSWSWSPQLLPATGSVVAKPGRHWVCVEGANWSECEEVIVNEVRAGSLLITELMIQPAGGPSKQWFEVANASRGPIDLEGMVIRVGAGTHTIQTGAPFLLGKGEIAVFARTNDPSVGPDYVYGTDPSMDMVAADGDVSIEWNGTTLAKVDWSPSWNVPSGATIGLSATELRGDTLSWTDSSVYSVATESYDGGANLGTPGIAGVMDTTHYLVDTFSFKPFIDIRLTGSVLDTLTADGGTDGIPLPFSMPFFGNVVNTIWADSNGWVSFAPAKPGTWHSSPSPLPRGSTASPAGPLIAVQWDDYGCSQSPLPFEFMYDQRSIDGQVVTILQWNNFNICGYTGGSTFQLQLWSGGDIVIAFDEMWWSGDSARQRYAGNTSWIGLEPPNRPDHVTALHRRPLIFAGRSYFFQAK